MSRKRPQSELEGDDEDLGLIRAASGPASASILRSHVSPIPTTTKQTEHLDDEPMDEDTPASIHVIKPHLSNIEKALKVIEYFETQNKFGLGDFLQCIFDPATTESLTKDQCKSLASWFNGQTRVGTRPAEIVDAIYRHPYGIHRDHNILQRAAFSELSTPQHSPAHVSAHPRQASLLPSIGSTPSTSVNAREGLEELMVRGTLYLVEREAQVLTDPKDGLPRGANLTWSDVDGLSDNNYRQKLQQIAPVLWAILSTVVLSRSIAGIIMAISILISFRNPLVNFFQSVMTVFLFSCNTHKTVYRALNRAGISTAHSTLHGHLNRLGQSAQAALKSLGRRAYESACNISAAPEQYFMLIFDNVNKYHSVSRNQTVASKNRMKNGTAATAVVLEDIPTGAFKSKPFWDNVLRGDRWSLTVDHLFSDIDQTHLAAVASGMIMRVLIAYIPTLPAQLHLELEQRFKVSGHYAKHRLRLRKSVTMPLGTSNIEEATASGVSDVLHDLVSTQMEMEPSWFENFLILVGGDQLSVDRLHKSVQYKAKDINTYESRRWVLPTIQLWHMKLAYLKSIFRVHWFESVGSRLFGLRQGVEALGRKINPDVVDFYACHNAVKIIFEAMVLTSAFTILEESASSRTQTIDQDHLISELAKHFAPGSSLHKCSIEQLEDLASRIYNRYMTTEAYQQTLSTPSSLSSSQVHDLILQELSHYNLGDEELLKTELQSIESAPADQLLGNTVLLMQDSFWYLEFASAIPEGDVGRVFEIIKILRFSFWGSNAANYGKELLEVACRFMFEYPKDLQEAILNNYLLNPSGLDGHWQEGDFFQEHSNKAIKTVFNSKNSEWDSRFLRDAVSVNITGLGRLRDTMMKFLGLGRTARGNSRPDFSADINVLASHYLREGAFDLRRGRFQEHNTADMFSAGFDRLESSILDAFLERTTAGEAPYTLETSKPEPEPESTEIPPEPLIMVDGFLTAMQPEEDNEYDEEYE
ncbi:hypothetical protein BDV93DRAFT_508619 [Ceratobasidium sp. AG-I]|nr:hypothetical protein BDV93DRAFT_508619 [Ceratobasidium sp. AG-I]